MPVIILVIISLALLFGFLNGMHDSRNVISTIVSSRAYPARVALGVTVLSELAGPFVLGGAVASTIGSGLADPKVIKVQVILVALLSAVLWNLLTWAFGIPSSSSHALIGGIIGAVTAQVGSQAINFAGLFKTLIALFTSPIIGFIFGFFLLRLILFLCRNSTPRINDFFKRSQLLTAIVLGLSHGSNDGQKIMGVITLALMTAGYIPEFKVPLWVMAICAVALSSGTTVGGWTLLRKPGRSYYKIRPVNGFTAQITSALVIITASIIGGPVSATQVINTAIVGIGAAERANKVRWHTAKDMFIAWVLTIPAAALLAISLYFVLLRYVPIF
jgi:PiT family inorganic phosphate transporter